MLIHYIFILIFIFFFTLVFIDLYLFIIYNKFVIILRYKKQNKPFLCKIFKSNHYIVKGSKNEKGTGYSFVFCCYFNAWMF